MKRFYKLAEAGTAPGGYTVRIDGKALRTPLQHPLIFTSATLATALAAEWQAQGDVVVPSSMPLNQLVNTMIDKSGGHDRPEMNAEVIKFAGSDLICYFATHPADLVVRQEKLWHPLLSWMQDEYGILLTPVAGIQYVHQPKESIAAITRMVRDMDAIDFTIVQAVTAITGSVVIALGMMAGRLGGQQAFDAACVDEIFQLDTWGEDAPARQRLSRILDDLISVEKFRFLVKSSL